MTARMGNVTHVPFVTDLGNRRLYKKALRESSLVGVGLHMRILRQLKAAHCSGGIS